MDRSKKSYFLKLCLIAAIIATPLLSASLRPTYLYFVFNLLIVAVGAEAGLLNFFSKAAEDIKPHVAASPASPLKVKLANATDGSTVTPQCIPDKQRMVEKSVSEKIVGAVKVHKVKKCPSTPSLFFIAGGETEAEKVLEDGGGGEEEEAGGISGQELFTKAETFIGNFYKQLKMQREESWKRIHGLYNKAF